MCTAQDKLIERAYIQGFAEGYVQVHAKSCTREYKKGCMEGIIEGHAFERERGIRDLIDVLRLFGHSAHVIRAVLRNYYFLNDSEADEWLQRAVNLT